MTDERRYADEAMALAHRALLVLIVGLGGFLLWACLAPLDQGVAATGTVVVAGERKTVQALHGGAIERILVREGERVERGQVLVQLNSVNAESERNVALAEWLAARSVEARLSAERLGRDSIEWPADLSARAADPHAQSAMALQDQLFATRRSELATQLEILDRERAARAEQLSGFRKIERSLDAQQKLQREELAGLRKLAEDGYVPRHQLLEVERSTAQLEAQRSAAIADVGRTQQSIHEIELQRVQKQQSFRSEAESQLAQVGAQISRLAEQLEALDFEVTSGAIVAPVAGRVIGLAIHTEGGVVPPGQTLMDIVPETSGWVAKAQFAPSLAEVLHPGLPVDVRFASLQRARTPVVAGRVATVSADRLVDEHTREPYYSVEIEPDPSAARESAAAGLEIKPGMQVEVLVKTGERSLANYLVQPLRERLASAFNEP